MPEPSVSFAFWWTWWVQVAVAAGTIGAVLVALFGQAFRAKFFPPQLSLRLLNPQGEKTRVRLTPPQGTDADSRMEDARYYHLRVSNTRRWSPANQVQVVLLRVEEPGPNDAFQITWTGDIPLGWRHQVLFPPSRTIGAEADVDLCSVVKDKWVELHTLIAPFNLEVRRRSPSTLVLYVQARGNECDSPVLRIRIAWDGKWHDGSEEMRRHLIVEQLGSDNYL